jgi:hypothetical protein
MTEYLGVITSIVIIVVLFTLLKKGIEKFDNLNLPKEEIEKKKKLAKFFVFAAIAFNLAFILFEMYIKLI